MKQLRLQNDRLHTVLSESADDDGIGFVQGRDYVQLTWDDAIRVRDWLQLAIAERVERLHVNGRGSPE